MIRVVAGLLRAPDFQGRGLYDVDKWKTIVEEFQDQLVSHDHLSVERYQRPVFAYELSVQSRGEEEKQVLAVLRHCPGGLEVSVAVVEAVWQGFWKTQDRTLFVMALLKLKEMNVVDIHQREHYGFKYGAHLTNGSIHVLTCVSC
jgi:hypothetical protein